MPSCCYERIGLNEIFTEKVLKRDTRRYRARGIDPRARRVFDEIRKRMELENRRTLEVGAGIGGLTIEMARAGAMANAIDATPFAVMTARILAKEQSVSDRTTFTEADFTTTTPERADVVVLDRVVCCYPDWRALVDKAAASAEQLLVLSWPRDNTVARVAISLANTWERVLRRTFRLHLHPPEMMMQRMRELGFQPVVTGHYWLWEIVVAARGTRG